MTIRAFDKWRAVADYRGSRSSTRTFRRLGGCSVVVFAASMACTSADQGPVASAQTAARTDKQARWTIDYGAQRCSLFRHVDGAQGGTLGLRIIPGSPSPELLFSRKDWGSKPLLDALQVTVVLLPGGAKYKSLPTTGKLEASGEQVLMIDNLGPEFLNALGAAQGIAFEARGKRQFELAFQGAGKAVASLRDCNDALLKAWGVDVVSPPAASQPEAIGYGWFSSDLYPASAFDKKVSGTVVARLDISAAGRPARCTVVAGSGDTALDDQTCATFMKRGRYKPALDRDGKPVAMSMVQTVHWVARN